MLKIIRFILLSFVIIITLNGCLLTSILIGTTAIAGSGIYYIKGNYVIEVPRDIRSVYNAAIKTLQTNKLYCLKKQKYSHNSALIKGNIGSENISINLKNINNRSTEIKIRFGILGDNKMSTELANQITKNIT